ncbi:prostate androgen-regulated mucin-like protein 1 [Chelonoidis abingdonii]|uniref:prostate androgen-regulated mucin-like protein 1 n=1 Tax=Chelonoidis abingdonii TaxID=106734 RepID=UPI0013F1FF1D|nr:prostate androgen-regulated mucin-like protein 1 isoform X1 [Chelonoidis abingdonii]
MVCPARLALLLLAAGLSVHSAHSELASSLSPSERSTIASESTQTTVHVTPAASTSANKLRSATAVTATTSRDKVTSGPAEQGNTTISSGTTKELSATTTHLASHTERANVSATSPSPSSSTRSELTATEHSSGTSVSNLTKATAPDTATPPTTAPDTATSPTTAPDTATPPNETPATTFSHLINTLSSSSSAGSSRQTTITIQNTTQLPNTNTSTAAPATEYASTKEMPLESLSLGPVIKQTSQVTLATKSVTEAVSTDSTTFSTGVTMEEVQRALSSGSIAAITVTVIVVVLLVFGVAAYLKIRHSSYGRLLDDHDYGSWGNYNNPLYDDS